MVIEQMIEAKDLKLLLVTDDLDEAIAYLDRNALQQFGLRRRARQPSWWLGETARD